jgi:multiple sugar transport system substrate-binding protein
MKLRGIDSFLSACVGPLLRAGRSARNFILKIIRHPANRSFDAVCKARNRLAGAFLRFYARSAANCLKVFLRNAAPNETPGERRRFFAGTAVLLACFAVNIVMAGQADMRFILGAAVSRNLVFTQWWEHDADTGILKSLINEFERQNPGIRVTLDTRPYTAIRELLFRAGDSPIAASCDILGLDPRWFGEPPVTGRLEPLSRYRGGDYGAFPAGEEYPGEEWGVPLVSFITLLFYNIDLLEEAGFDRPPKNHAEFAAAARAVSAGSGRYGFGIALSPDDPRGLYRDILPWVFSSASFADGDSPPRFNAEELTPALELLDKLRREGVLAPESFAKTGKDRIGEFADGRAAMILASTADTRPFRNAGFRIGVTSVPLRESYTGKPLYALDRWYAGVSRNSKYKDDAFLFIRFLAGRGEALSAYWGAVPRNSAEDGGAEEDPLLSKALDIYNAGEARKEYAGWKTSLFEKVMTEELRLMLETGQTPQDAAAKIQQRLEAGG